MIMIMTVNDDVATTRLRDPLLVNDADAISLARSTSAHTLSFARTRSRSLARSPDSISSPFFLVLSLPLLLSFTVVLPLVRFSLYLTLSLPFPLTPTLSHYIICSFIS